MALDDQSIERQDQLTDKSRRVIRSTAELTQAFYILLLTSAGLSLPVLIILVRAYFKVGGDLTMGRLLLFQSVMLGFNIWLAYHVHLYSKALGELWRNPSQESMDYLIGRQKNLWVFLGTMSCLLTFSMLIRILLADIGNSPEF